MAAGKFKDVCLKTLDEVARPKASIVITKRGRPVAKLVPCGVARGDTQSRWQRLEGGRRPVQHAGGVGS